MKKWLLCRFGGIGDLMAVTAVSKAIKSKFPNDTVDIGVRGAEQVTLVHNIPSVNKAFEIRRFPDPLQGANCVKIKDGWENLDLYKNRYDWPIDLVNAVENNTMHRELLPLGEWALSQNSNFVNWIDLQIGWCNIDPTTVEDKRPEYVITQDERNWARNLLMTLPRPIFGLNLFASSRSRTHFSPAPFIKEILDEWKGCTVLMWKDGDWYAIRDAGEIKIDTGTQIRRSVAILGEMDVYVSADSGFSHLAEAVGTENVTIYTTVPAWTRNAYYKFSHDIDIRIPCSPCFTLHYLCPVNRKRAGESLSDRDKQILSAAQSGMHVMQAAMIFNTSPDKLQQEFQAIQARMDSVASVLPDCVQTVTPSMVIDRMIDALKKKEERGESKVQEVSA